MKYLFRELFDKFVEKTINTYIHKKSEEKEATFDENNFVAYHEPRRIIIFFLLFLVCPVITIGFYSVDKTFNIAVKICLAFSVVAFFTLIYILTYRCYVDETGFTVKKFFVLKKFIPREEFFDVDITKWQPRNSDNEGLLIVRNEKGKKIFDASKDLVGFGLMCKKAKRFERKKSGEIYD